MSKTRIGFVSGASVLVNESAETVRTIMEEPFNYSGFRKFTTISVEAGGEEKEATIEIRKEHITYIASIA